MRLTHCLLRASSLMHGTFTSYACASYVMHITIIIIIIISLLRKFTVSEHINSKTAEPDKKNTYKQTILKPI